MRLSQVICCHIHAPPHQISQNITNFFRDVKEMVNIALCVATPGHY